MHLIVLLMALLTRAVAPHIHVTTLTSDSTYLGVSTMPPTVFSAATSPRKVSARRGKADSPMLNYIFDSYATSNKHFHDKLTLNCLIETLLFAVEKRREEFAVVRIDGLKAYN
ncbi:unnamed protein product [Euphydryas editha]|uniref:Uncharacterized protein n=1 Tax=Euphydryas editha TaxID=104508 RepID=A0AAU9UCN1_EUPED|nr:unnamed protein product [Euphydryas editha]